MGARKLFLAAALGSVLAILALPAMASAAQATTPTTPDGPTRPTTTTTSAMPAWLTELNRVRTEAGLGSVTAVSNAPNPGTNYGATTVSGMKEHIKYLVNDTSWQTGPYRDLHSENPSAPDHSKAGLAAGETSVIAFGTKSDLLALDAWLSAPIHAADLMKPDLTTVVYYRDPVSGDAMLDTGGGLGSGNPQVLYPGDGGTTHLTRFGGENPDPTQSCPASYQPVNGQQVTGLPLFAIMPSAPTSTSTATLTLTTLSDTRANVPVCVLDQNTFKPTGVYGPTAEQYFQNGLILVIPQKPLVPGSYTVDLRPGGESPVSWTFTSAPTAMPPTLGYATSCSFANPAYASGQAKVGINNPPDTTRATTYTVTLDRHTTTVTVPDGGFGHTHSFTHLPVGTYQAKVVGNDHTSGTEKITIPACPTSLGVTFLRGATYSPSRHQLTQTISNQRNLTAVTLTVKRSGLSTLHVKLPAKGKATIHVGVHPHGSTMLTYLVGATVIGTLEISV